jgi:Lysyl oxidase
MLRMMIRRLVAVLPLVAVLAAAAASSLPAAKPGGGTDLSQYYPDLRTVVPLHLNLVNQQQQEVLRFSNGIANTGSGPLALRPEPPPVDATTTTTAVQEIRDPADNIVDEVVTGTFAFHPQHNHWHIGDVALFEVRKDSPTGPVVGDLSIKTTFCLIDWYKLTGNAATSERVFWECATSFQGISPDWVDQYHQSTVGQQLDITGVADGDYYLVSTSNFARRFVESDYTNNTAWVKFHLGHDSNGNRKVTELGHSQCETAALCGEGAPNR